MYPETTIIVRPHAVGDSLSEEVKNNGIVMHSGVYVHRPEEKTAVPKESMYMYTCNN